MLCIPMLESSIYIRTFKKEEGLKVENLSLSFIIKLGGVVDFHSHPEYNYLCVCR